jgi:hypothetical protein
MAHSHSSDDPLTFWHKNAMANLSQNIPQSCSARLFKLYYPVTDGTFTRLFYFALSKHFGKKKKSYKTPRAQGTQSPLAESLIYKMTQNLIGSFLISSSPMPNWVLDAHNCSNNQTLHHLWHPLAGGLACRTSSSTMFRLRLNVCEMWNWT